MNQSDFSHSVEVCDHLTTRSDRFGPLRAGTILHHNFPNLPRLDTGDHSGIEAPANFLLGNTPAVEELPMADSLTSSMRDQIMALLTDQISVFEFQDWFVGATWDVEQHDDPDAAELAYSSKLALAELSRGDISQAAFRERMHELVGTPVPFR